LKVPPKIPMRSILPSLPFVSDYRTIFGSFGFLR